MVLCSLFASLTVLCSWLSIPVPPVGITLQTFAVLTALGTLGGRRGSAAITLYLLLGAVGLPVFSGFRGSLGALLDPTGGFLWGFLLGGLVYWLTEKSGTLPAMVLCQMTVYLCGCLWLRHYTGTDLLSAAAVSVVPFLVPDTLKLLLALYISKRLSPHIKNA